MADKIFENSEYLVVRFPCDCGSQGHSADIALELADNGKRIIQCSFNLYMDGKAPLKFRLKQIWKLLKGEEGQLADFIIRTEDVPAIIELLQRIGT